VNIKIQTKSTNIEEAIINRNIFNNFFSKLSVFNKQKKLKAIVNFFLIIFFFKYKKNQVTSKNEDL